MSKRPGPTRYPPNWPLPNSLLTAGILLFALATNGHAQSDITAIDFGDDASTWANDQECDDPRFAGDGIALTLAESDRMHDASDCRSLFEAGSIYLIEDAAPIDAGVDFGDNVSDGAFDEKCNDPRFAGRGMASPLLDTDMFHDAQDCRTLFEQGSIRLLPGSTMVLSGRLERGRLGFGDDTRNNGSYSDSFRIVANRGDSLVADLRSGEFDTLLIVRPTRGEEISNDDFEGSSSRSQVTIPRMETGFYEIIVSSTSPAASGAYTLWITKDD